MSQTSNQTLATIIQEALTPEQIQRLLETIYNYPAYGACPLCEGEDIPVDERGNPLPEDASPEQWSNARWRDSHDEDCIVTLLSKQAEREVRHAD